MCVKFSCVLSFTTSEDPYDISEVKPIETFRLSDFCKFYAIHNDPIFRKPKITHRFKNGSIVAYSRGVIRLLDEMRDIT